MQLDFSQLSQNKRYHLMTQTVVPRPIAWVLTENENADEANQYNLAPFSFFNAICAEPALLVLGFTLKGDGSAKDTWHNLVHNKHCTIHLADNEQLHALVATSAELPYGQSEIRAGELSITKFEGHQLPRLSHAPVAFGCKLHSYQTFGKDEGSGVVFCEIMHIYIKDELCEHTPEGRIIVDTLKYSPPARLGGQNYATMLKVEQLQRPK